VDAGLRTRHVNVVDGDLSHYFDTIPHDALIKSVERRIADGKVLWLLRHWLKAPVQETTARGKTVHSGGQGTKVGTPQGGVISPLLANIYFRRFLVAWRKFGYEQRYGARIVNYADDFVILCRGSAQEAYAKAQDLLTRLGLKLNVEKTRVVRAWQDSFDFLGYTFGVVYTRAGRSCLGKRPSHKNVLRYRQRVRQLTNRGQTWKQAGAVAKELNELTQGFWGYFHLGATNHVRHVMDYYLRKRMFIWAKRKHAPSRRKKNRASGHANRWQQIREALSLVKLSSHLRPWRDGELFAGAASYAQ
jgi:group II intron reverse transcriptase/maturase